MNIRPLGDHVVVKPLKEEEVTASGIVLPDTVDKEKKAEGEVIAVGPGKLLDSGLRGQMDVKVGDRVFFKKWGGDEIEIDIAVGLSGTKKEEYKIISQEDILAIVE